MYERGLARYLTLALFLGPSLAGIGLFVLLPIVASLGLSFTDWDLLTPASFVGTENYAFLAADPEFWDALRHTATFTVLYVPLVIGVGLLVAVALNSAIPGRNAFRAMYFLPVVSSWVAVALLWKWLLNPSYGLVNAALAVVGIQGPAWLFDAAWAMPAVVVASVWKDLGFIMVILLAGLQNISREYYEAASIDGASGTERLRFITVPLLVPTLVFALMISLIGAFQVFDQVYVMTGGGPAGATTVVIERIVNNAFAYSRMGYAATMSWALFIIILASSLVFSRLQRRWAP